MRFCSNVIRESEWKQNWGGHQLPLGSRWSGADVWSVGTVPEKPSRVLASIPGSHFAAPPPS
ncbi:hypothetical protein E2C01_089372 [Portunus trituberculatus]|uniref:Uncharacterized protein n=1 Tax=Portunus trituberculatus TaxID=210409 RepID=A0A5B7JI00_PORTR|nr:hypothetical protein [Portunus trituberculatus]